MTLTQALINAGIVEDEADAREEIREAKSDLLEIITSGDDLENAFDFCQDRWGLEPDYLDELIPV